MSSDSNREAGATRPRRTLEQRILLWAAIIGIPAALVSIAVGLKELARDKYPAAAPQSTASPVGTLTAKSVPDSKPAASPSPKPTPGADPKAENIVSFTISEFEIEGGVPFKGTAIAEAFENSSMMVSEICVGEKFLVQNGASKPITLALAPLYTAADFTDSFYLKPGQSVPATFDMPEEWALILTNPKMLVAKIRATDCRKKK